MDTTTTSSEQVRRVLDLADKLETDGMSHLQPWMIARLLRVAITDDLRSAITPEPSA